MTSIRFGSVFAMENPRVAEATAAEYNKQTPWGESAVAFKHVVFTGDDARLLEATRSQSVLEANNGQEARFKVLA